MKTPTQYTYFIAYSAIGYQINKMGNGFYTVPFIIEDEESLNTVQEIISQREFPSVTVKITVINYHRAKRQ